MISLSLSRLFRRRTAADAAQAEGSASKLLIVPRALSPAYYFFLRAFAKENFLNVIVDRREGERRGRPRPVFGDRRHDDRRHKPSTTWDRDGDSRIASDEIPHFYQLTLGRAQLAGIGNPGLAFSGNREIARPEPTNAGPNWFRRMDRSE